MSVIFYLFFALYSSTAAASFVMSAAIVSLVQVLVLGFLLSFGPTTRVSDDNSLILINHRTRACDLCGVKKCRTTYT
jgi:hypothetical protein